MTIKVYLTNGKVEEYPNAHIYWEWDEDEKGTDSGFRISSMDRLCNTATAFVYPSECTKIEINSEECDKIFTRTPIESSISGKRWPIFAAINKERERQDDKFGKQNHPMLGTFVGICPSEAALKDELKLRRDRIKHGHTGWFDILMEEVCEAFLARKLKNAREEMVQVAAVAVAIIEYLDRMEEPKKRIKRPTDTMTELKGGVE
jgi:hypothetical protein